MIGPASSHSACLFHLHFFLSASLLLYPLSLSLSHSTPSPTPPLPLVGCFQAVRALQLQRVDSCDALLATATAAAGEEEEDGTGMELTQLLNRIRAQCEQNRLSGPERHPSSNLLPGLPGPSCSGAAAAAASRTHRGALSEVRTHSCTLTYSFLQLTRVVLAHCQADTPSGPTPSWPIGGLLLVFD